jgi:crossover junction endodeoxyribonuclease RuvC
MVRPVTFVRPQVWTKALGVGSDKGAHREAACRLFPTDAEQFARVKDDGRADAALLAHWWMRGPG